MDSNLSLTTARQACQAHMSSLSLRTMRHASASIQLQGCDIYLLDHTAAVTVDDCIECRIFTGPVASRYIVVTSTGAVLPIADFETEAGSSLVQHFLPRLQRLYIHHNMSAVQVCSSCLAPFASLFAASSAVSQSQPFTESSTQQAQLVLAGPGTATIARLCSVAAPSLS